MIGVLLKYSDFFNDDEPNDKFDLVKHIPRCELIANFSSLNHLLKNPLELDFNFSFENQAKMVGTIYQLHNDERGIQYCRSIITKLKWHYDSLNGGASICTRASCLFALNEILFSDKIEFEEKPGIKFYPDDYLAIFKFSLLCNTELLTYNEPYNLDITSDKLGDDFFQVFMFKEIPSNQYGYIQNPINLFERGRQLFDYLKAKYSNELSVFTKKYKIDSPEHFISIVANHFLVNSAGIEQIQAYKVPRTDKDTIERLNALSKRGE